MIFAVAMTFIDQTIVAIAVPELQKDLSLSSTGVQWIINGYLLSLSALFAFGGRLSDIVGHKTMVIVGVVGFAVASGLCGATPTGDIGEAWIIFFRVVQGAFAALMFPAALAIVVSAFDAEGARQGDGDLLRRYRRPHGRRPAGGRLPHRDHLAGDLLGQHPGRDHRAHTHGAVEPVEREAPGTARLSRRRARVGRHGARRARAAAVLGWGWGDPATLGSIVVGVALLIVFVLWELRAEQPLIKVSRSSATAASPSTTSLLFLMSMAFVPLFFFSSLYAQIGLEQSASEAGLYLLIFFAGFASAAQIGGRILDKRGARGAVVPGAIIAAAGFALWAQQLPDLDLNNQWYWIVMTGAGMGLMLGPASTDAVNRAPRTSYGEVTGITQTARNFGASLGLALLGTIFISQNESNIESSLSLRGRAAGPRRPDRRRGQPRRRRLDLGLRRAGRPASARAVRLGPA